MSQELKSFPMDLLASNELKKNRREFLIDSAKTIGLIISGTAIASFLNSCGSNSNPVSIDGRGQKVSLDLSKSQYISLKNVGGKVTLSGSNPSGVPSNGAIIYRKSETEINVLDRTCTHQACQISGLNSSGISNCPCHGSEFNSEGNVVRGPANRALKKYDAVLNGNNLEIQF